MQSLRKKIMIRVINYIFLVKFRKTYLVKSWFWWKVNLGQKSNFEVFM